jgi:DNA-binding NtrC family response regulator
MPPNLTREATIALNAYSFPGNVRELENALRRAVALSSTGLVTVDCLPAEITNAGRKPGSLTTAGQRLIADRPDMDELQRRYLQLILDETGWNRRQAAAVLHLDRRTIQRLIARYGLQGPAEPEGDAEGDAEHTE